jgi:cytochrome c553
MTHQLRRWSVTVSTASKSVVIAFFVTAATPSIRAADISGLGNDSAASRTKAATVCAACHGVNGVSVADHIPNLAGQKSAYLSSQLAALKQSTRKSDIMNVIAATLTDDEITQLAAHYSSLTNASAQTKSSLLPNIAKTRVSFPENYKTAFTRYLVDNVAEDKQVKHYYANAAAVDAARTGQPLPDGSMIIVEIYSAKLDESKKPVVGADDYYVADQLRSYATMASGKGWGNLLPDALRNGDWNYAVFSPKRALIKNVNQAECLACHLPAKETSYVFTAKQIQRSK